MTKRFGRSGISSYQTLPLLVLFLGTILAADTAYAQCAVPTEASTLLQFRPKNNWTFAKNVSDRITLRVQDAPLVINNVTTYGVSEGSPADSTDYFSDNCSGIELHRLTEQDEDVGVLTTSFEPPIPVVNANPHAGETLTKNGTALFSAPGLGPFTGSYSSSVQVLGFENVTVPAGTFRALRARWVLRLQLSNVSPELDFDETDTSTFWLAAGTGIVKSTETSSVEPGTDTLELIDFELVNPVPTTGLTDAQKILPALMSILLDD